MMGNDRKAATVLSSVESEESMATSLICTTTLRGPAAPSSKPSRQLLEAILDPGRFHEAPAA